MWDMVTDKTLQAIHINRDIKQVSWQYLLKLYIHRGNAVQFTALRQSELHEFVLYIIACSVDLLLGLDGGGSGSHIVDHGVGVGVGAVRVGGSVMDGVMGGVGVGGSSVSVGGVSVVHGVGVENGGGVMDDGSGDLMDGGGRLLGGQTTGCGVFEGGGESSLGLGHVGGVGDVCGGDGSSLVT